MSLRDSENPSDDFMYLIRRLCLVSPRVSRRIQTISPNVSPAVVSSERSALEMFRSPPDDFIPSSSLNFSPKQTRRVCCTLGDVIFLCFHAVLLQRREESELDIESKFYSDSTIVFVWILNVNIKLKQKPVFTSHNLNANVFTIWCYVNDIKKERPATGGRRVQVVIEYPFYSRSHP